MQKNSAAAAKFIFVTIFLDALGIGLLIPVMPDVIRRFSGDPVFVAQYYGYFISAYALMQFLASPVLGSLSDRFGRKPILLISLLAAGFDYLLMAFAPTLSILFVGRVISGLTGASATVASSYMADVSDDTNRSANFGLIGAAWGMGFIVGPALGGLLGHQASYLPFLAAAVLNILNFIFGVYVLPESLPLDQRRKVEMSRLNPFKSVIKILKPSPIFFLVWAYLLIYLSGQVHPATWTLYTEYKFHWTNFDVGMSLSFVGVSIAFVQGYLTRIVIPKIGEAKSLWLGLFFYIVGFAMFAFANHGWMMYAIMLVFALSGFAGPSLQSLISKDVPRSEQGELQGSLISIASLTAVVGPILYTGLFARFTRPEGAIIFSGAPYLAASLICVIALVLVGRWPKAA